MRSSFWEATLKDKLCRLLVMALMVFAISYWIGIRAGGVVLAFILLFLVKIRLEGEQDKAKETENG